MAKHQRYLLNQINESEGTKNMTSKIKDTLLEIITEIIEHKFKVIMLIILIIVTIAFFKTGGFGQIPPIVEQINDATYSNQYDIETSDLYRINLNDGLVTVYHNSETYTALYQNKTNNSIGFTSPTGDKLVVKLMTQNSHDNPEKHSGVGFLKAYLSVNDGPEIMLNAN